MEIPNFDNLRQATDQEIREWMFRNEVIPRILEGGFDRRFIPGLEMPTKQKWAYDQMKGKLKGVGAIVALVGVRGSGKTHMTAELAKERAANEELSPSGRQVIYRRMTALVTKYKALYADFGSIDSDVALDSRDAICRNPELLVIDEIHESDDQKLKNRILTDLVDRRYAGLKDTILISNQSPEEFQRTTSDSILSRLGQHGMIIPCKWPTFRTPQ